jgi:hypothetical protein
MAMAGVLKLASAAAAATVNTNFFIVYLPLDKLSPNWPDRAGPRKCKSPPYRAGIWMRQLSGMMLRSCG